MKTNYLFLGLVIFVAALGAITLWSVVAEQIVATKLQDTAATNPLLSLLTGKS